MLNNIVLGRYYPIKSLIHSMNPTSKIICVFLFVIITIINNSFFMNLLLLGLSGVIIWLTNIPVKLYIASLKKMGVFLIFIFLINIIFKMSLIINLSMVIKIVLIVNYSTILTLTTPPTEITYGLEMFLKSLRSLKIPVNKISLSISLALRFIPTILDQATKILKSQASRGIDYYNSNFKGKLEAIKSMLIPMISLSIKRADLLADAMEVRLFSFDIKRSNYRINKWRLFDTIAVIIHILLIIIIVVKEVIV